MSSEIQQKPKFGTYCESNFRLGDKTCPVFSPAKRSGSAVFALYGSIVSKALEDIERTALEKIRKTAPDAAGDLFVIRKGLVHSSIQEFKESVTEEKQQARKLLRVTKLTGLNEAELTSCAKLAKTFATQFFNGDCYFAYSANKKQLEEWKKDKMVEALNFLYVKLGMKPSAEPVAFKEEDLAIFEVQRDQITTVPKDLNCLRFALLVAKELQAKDLIFKNPQDDRAMRQLFRNLARWNYEPVSEPTAGDLVVYLDEDKPDHVGVYLGDDLVHSKIGVANPYSHTHRLFAIDEKALFFRKK